MSSADVKTLKLYESGVIIPDDEYTSGVQYFDFRIQTGSRLLFTVLVKSADPGSKVKIEVLNSFTVESAYDNILEFETSGTGFFKRVLTDFNKLFRFKATVTGNIQYSLAVSVFDNAMTTVIENAEIDVHLTDKDTATRGHDAVRIGNGVYQATVNPDGSFNVNIVDAVTGVPELVVSKFNETPAVSNGTEELIVGYTVPALKKSRLQRIEFSGQNIASYSVYLNGDLFAKKQTWFNGPMCGEFSFIGTSEEGPKLNAGDVIELKVIHARPFAGSFAGRIQLIELG